MRGRAQRRHRALSTLYVRLSLLERYPVRLSPRSARPWLSFAMHGSIKPKGAARSTRRQFAALQAADHLARTHSYRAGANRDQLVLAKVREDLGTSDPDFIALMGKRSPNQIAAAIVGGTG